MTAFPYIYGLHRFYFIVLYYDQITVALVTIILYYFGWAKRCLANGGCGTKTAMAGMAIGTRL